MIPKVDGDATPLEQRPLCVLPVDYRIWASAFMIQQKKWFRFWLPDWVYSAGGGRSSVEVWYTTALGIGTCSQVLFIFMCMFWLLTAPSLLSLLTDFFFFGSGSQEFGFPAWFWHAFFRVSCTCSLVL